MVTFPRGIVLGLLVASTAACASRDDVTPTIVVSPGAKERILVMDRFRHHGSPRRILPKVTVEEVDESELPAPPSDTRAESNAASAPEGPADDAADASQERASDAAEPANERARVTDEARAPRSAP